MKNETIQRVKGTGILEVEVKLFLPSRNPRSRALKIGLAVMLSWPFLLSQAVAASQSAPPPAKSEKANPPNDGNAGAGGAMPAPSNYRVGADDEFTIAVWHEPEFTQAVVVRPDGMITLPLVNDIQVAGLTIDQMQALVAEKLKNVVNDPQVTVILKAIHSRKVSLVGAVAKQGTYALSGKKTVLELIAEAGGLGVFAKTGSIYILRKTDGKEVRIPFNYKKALSGKAADPELMPGDLVVVP